MITIFSTTFDPSTEDVMNWLHYYINKTNSVIRINSDDEINKISIHLNIPEKLKSNFNEV